MSKKLVSVIIPTYNRAAYIADAVQSVLDQKLPAKWELEVLVVDDGSTDNTDKAVKKFDKQITYIKIPYAGLPAVPRNVGLKRAKGSLVAFQDSDDAWAPDKLTAQLPVFDDPSVVFSYGQAEIMDSDGRKTGELVVQPEVLSYGESFAKLAKNNSISTLTVMTRRDAVLAAGGFNEAKKLFSVEDYELWLRLCAKYPKGFKLVNKTLAYYRRHDQNISQADNLLAIERLLTVYNSLWQTNLSPAQRKQLEAVWQDTHQSWGRIHDIMHPEQKPLVSVVMSVYNGAEHLKPSVQGILDQTFKDFEFIIIDDGSSDKSAQIIEKFRDKRIRLIKQTNHGLVYSLNKGVELARGKYIARQDADDISLPKRFAKEVKLLESDPKLGVVGTYFTYIDEKTGKPGLTISMPTKSLDVKRALYNTNPIGHGTAMIRREALGTPAYSDEYGPTEDFELWRRIADNWELAIIPESLYNYLLNTNSISHTNTDVQHAYMAKVIAEQWAKPLYYKKASEIVRDGQYYRSFPKYGPGLYDYYSVQQIEIAKGLLNRGSLKAGLPTAYAAIRLKPKSYYLFIKPLLRGTMIRLGIKR